MEAEKNCYESKHTEQQFRHFHIHRYLNSKGTEILKYSFKYTQSYLILKVLSLFHVTGGET